MIHDIQRPSGPILILSRGPRLPLAPAAARWRSLRSPGNVTMATMAQYAQWKTMYKCDKHVRKMEKIVSQSNDIKWNKYNM